MSVKQPAKILKIAKKKKKTKKAEEPKIEKLLISPKPKVPANTTSRIVTRSAPMKEPREIKSKRESKSKERSISKSNLGKGTISLVGVYRQR
jgi:hypothetical protein